MSKKLKVLLASRSAEALKRLEASLAGAQELSVNTRLISNGHADPLHGLHAIPDVLVLRFDVDSLAELAALAQSHPEHRPPLIVVGPAGNPDAMRLAIRSGARDFLAEPLNADELVASVERFRHEPRRSEMHRQPADVMVVLGAAGGVGTSFLSCNLAQAFAAQTGAGTLLMDMDVNSAPLTGFLDLNPERGLPGALTEVEYLDHHALAGYVTRHRSGLHLIGAPSKSTLFSRDLDQNRFASLMSIITERYRWVVVDAAHTLTELTATTLGMSKAVVLVVQQSVIQLRQAARTMRILFSEFGIQDDRITVVVNRYSKRAEVSLEDMQRTLAREKLVVLPNSFKSVSASIDGGLPLLDFEPASPVAKAIVDLQKDLCGTPRAEKTGLLRRALPMFSGEKT